MSLENELDSSQNSNNAISNPAYHSTFLGEVVTYATVIAVGAGIGYSIGFPKTGAFIGFIFCGLAAGENPEDDGDGSPPE